MLGERRERKRREGRVSGETGELVEKGETLWRGKRVSEEKGEFLERRRRRE